MSVDEIKSRPRQGSNLRSPDPKSGALIHYATRPILSDRRAYLTVYIPIISHGTIQCFRLLGLGSSSDYCTHPALILAAQQARAGAVDPTGRGAVEGNPWGTLTSPFGRTAVNFRTYSYSYCSNKMEPNLDSVSVELAPLPYFHFIHSSFDWARHMPT